MTISNKNQQLNTSGSMNSIKLTPKTKIKPNSKIIEHIESWQGRKAANDNYEQYTLVFEADNDNEPEN